MEKIETMIRGDPEKIKELAKNDFESWWAIYSLSMTSILKCSVNIEILSSILYLCPNSNFTYQRCEFLDGRIHAIKQRERRQGYWLRKSLQRTTQNGNRARVTHFLNFLAASWNCLRATHTLKKVNLWFKSILWSVNYWCTYYEISLPKWSDRVF